MSKNKFYDKIYNNYYIEFCLKNDKNKNKFSYSVFPNKIFSNQKLRDALLYSNKQFEKKYFSLKKKVLLSSKNSFRTLDIVNNNSDDMTRNKSKHKELKSFPYILINNLENKDSDIFKQNKLNMNTIRLIKKKKENQKTIFFEKQKPLNLYLKNLYIKKEKFNEIVSNSTNKTPKIKVNTSNIFLLFKDKITSYKFNNSLSIKNINNSNRNNIQLKNKLLRLKSFNLKQDQNSIKSLKSLNSSTRNKINNSII